MKFTIEVDPFTESPNSLGEFLRNRYFDQNPDGSGDDWSFGCYNTFDLREGLVKEHISKGDCWKLLGWEEDDVTPTGYSFIERGGIVDMVYAWDGDGMIVFRISDGLLTRTIINTDCKKNYNWRDE